MEDKKFIKKTENTENIDEKRDIDNLNKEIKIEKRTLEELLKDLREEKGWTYIHIVEELNKIKYVTNEKQVKKWEIGIEYPDLDTIYKLSELYLISSETFVIAKNNSLQKGLESIHMLAIKWICYFTGISIKVIYISIHIIMGLALIWAFMFFIDKTNTFMEVRKMMKGT